MKFISLDADDVIYQDGGSAYLNSAPNAADEATSAGAMIPNGTVTYNRFYTGDLKVNSEDFSLRPDFSTGTPNLQTIWLERTLREARENNDIDMIVVFMHQCALSTSLPGNGSDLGIRQTWLPLFDQYEVDLVLSGHEHDYERSYPVRGYDADYQGTVASPNPDQTKGEQVNTRRPHVVTTDAATHNGTPAWDTQQGTVFLVLGGGGTDGPTNTYGKDTATGLPQAKVITERNAISGSQAAGFTRNAADSIEDAPWSAAINASDAYGYAIFDVDPGKKRGDTTITFQYFAIPAVSDETGPLHDGTTTLPSTPTEKFVFGRGISGGGKATATPPSRSPQRPRSDGSRERIAPAVPFLTRFRRGTAGVRPRVYRTPYAWITVSSSELPAPSFTYSRSETNPACRGSRTLIT